MIVNLGWNNIKIDMNYLTQVKHHTAASFVTENSVGKTVKLFMKKLMQVKKLLIVGFVTNTLFKLFIKRNMRIETIQRIYNRAVGA